MVKRWISLRAMNGGVFGWGGEVVERRGQVLLSGQPGGHLKPEITFRARVMIAREHLHRVGPARLVTLGARTAVEVGVRNHGVACGRIVIYAERPTGEHAGEFGDVTLVVGGDRQTVVAEHQRAVRMEFYQTDREQLHDLTREVLIRRNHHHARAVDDFLLVAKVGQVVADHRVERHPLQQIPERTCAAVLEHVVVVG